MTNQKARKPGKERAFKNIQHTNIVTESQIRCQAINHLASYIKQKRLTDCLELLESVGINGDFALLVIGCFNKGLVA
jgi:hypothetical protein